MSYYRCFPYGGLSKLWSILGPHYNTGPNLGDPKRDHNFDNPPYTSWTSVPVRVENILNCQADPFGNPNVDSSSYTGIQGYVGSYYGWWVITTNKILRALTNLGCS